MKQLGRLFRRSQQAGSKRKPIGKRRLRTETLERRQLLAGDILAAHHNYFVPPDVNSDFQITPLDALLVINHMNRYGAGSLEGMDAGGVKVDVDADHQVTPADALRVINALNSGEAVGELVELRLDVRDTNDVSLLNSGSRTATVGVDEIVNLEVSYNDLRQFGADIGAFTVFTDIFSPNSGITLADYLEPIVTETQDLIISGNLRQGTGGNIVFGLEGQSGTYTSPFSTFANNPNGEVANALVALGYTADQIRVSRLPSDPDDPNPPFEFRIRYLGNDLANQDLPDLQVDASGVTGAAVTTQLIEIAALNPDGSVNPAAIPFNINTKSRTFNNDDYYNLSNSGSFGPNGFDDVGGIGRVEANGIPGFNEPFDAFSLPVRIIQPIQNLVLQLDPPDADAAQILLYPGNEGDVLSSDQILIDTVDDPAISGDDRFGLVVLNVVEGLVAGNGTLTVAEDAQTNNTINLLPLVENLAGGTVSIVSVGTAANGTVTLSGSTATYVPAGNFNGTDSFTYTATNGTNTATGTVNVTVTAVNDPPVANPDTIEAVQQPRIIQATELTGNDTGGPSDENQTVTITAVAPVSTGTPTQGTVVLNGNGTVTYTPPTGFTGTDRFQYTIQDSQGASATAIVTVTVTEQNVAPVAIDDTLNGSEDTPLNFTAAQLVANDQDSTTPQFVSLTQPTVGSITDNGGGSFTYNPPANVFGTGFATFTYTISDGEFQDTGNVTINLAAVNDPPVAGDDTFTIDELTADNVLPVLDNDNPGPNEDAQTLTITNITQPSNGSATIATDGQSILYTAGDQLGETTLTYTVTDAGGLTDTATVTIDVVPVIRPRARGDQFTVAEDSGTTTVDVLGNDLPNLGEEATLETIGAVTTGSATVARNDNGTPADLTDDRIDVTPAADFNGPIVFTYTISDTAGVVTDQAAATGTVTVTVTAVNDPPTFVADPARTTAEDTALAVPTAQLLANDIKGPANEASQTLSVSAVAATSAQNGSVTLTGGTINYTPRANFSGSDTITYTISDGAGGTTTGTLTVTVTPVNDAPVPGSPSFTTTEDTPLTISQANVLSGTLPGPTGDAAETGQTVSVTGPTSGSSTQGGTVAVGSGGAVTYTPAANFFGTDTFTLTVADNGTPSQTAQVTVTVNVTSVNDPPVANPDTVDAFQNFTSTFNASQFLGNDSPGPANETGQTLTLTGVSPISGTTTGSVSLNTNGTVSYTPAADFTGTDTFRYTVSDGQSTSTGTVTVNVQPFRPSTISGSVFFDHLESLSNPFRDGVQDADEPGLSGVTVRLVSAANENVSGTAINVTRVTMTDGSYTFANVPPGTYRVQLELPSTVVDGPDTPGTLGDQDNVENQFTIQIQQPGGTDATGYGFTVLGLQGAAGETLDLLASTYLANNPDTAAASDFGNEGAIASLRSDGSMELFKAGSGFEDVEFAQVAVNEEGDSALLTMISQDGSVRTARLGEGQFLAINDGNGGRSVQIFGAPEDFEWVGSVDDLLASEFGDYRDAIDQILTDGDSVL